MWILIQKHHLYFLGLVGAIAGFLSWALLFWVAYFWPTSPVSVKETIDSITIALIIGILCIAFVDYQKAKKVNLLHLFYGATGGLIAGFSSSSLARGIETWGLQAEFPWWLPKILAWLITGVFLGITIGVIRYRRNIQRVLLSMGGGAIGAAFAGTILLPLGEYLPYFARAIALMVTGCSIALCAAAAVEVLLKATLEFIESENSDAKKILEKNSPWELLPTERCLIGSSDTNGKKGIRDTFIHVPDSYVERRHLWIVGTKDGFRLRAHEENRNPDNNPGETWIDTDGRKAFEPAHNDDLLSDGAYIKVGETILRFSYKRKKNEKH